MDKFYINAILKWIWSNLSCKKCKAKIPLDKIELLSQSNEMANFQVTCPNCEAIMKIAAEINPVETGPIKKKRIQVKSNPKIEWKMNIKDTIIKKDELSFVSKKLKWLSSFKWLFWIFLIVMLVNFSWCEKSDETKKDILWWIEQVKDQWLKIYEDWKKLTSSASTLIDSAPEKINKIKGDAEKIVEDAKNVKAQADQKLKEAKEALEKAEKAQGAFSEALEAFYKFIWTEESWTWEAVEESGSWEIVESGSWEGLGNE